MAAPETVLDVAVPTPDEEIWRYSRIDELDLARLTPTTYEPEVIAPSGLAVGVVTERSDADLFDDERPDVFADLGASLTTAVSITVPAGVTVDGPISITHRVPRGSVISASRLVIEAGADAEVTVIERFMSDHERPDDDAATDGVSGASARGREPGDGGVFLPMTQLVAHRAARVKYLGINELDDDVWSIGHQQSRGDADSSTLIASVALGGYYARTRTHARLHGPGSSTRQVALYFAGGDQMHDFRTIQDHAAPHTTSDLLFKGAVQDRSRSVYTGLIKIRENAGGTTAYQTNRNLTLSEGAWAESVPNLDIETNDVKCSHASTVGPIDEDQRFYLESRGVRPEVAERLVVLGFFDEVLDQLPAGSLGPQLRRAVADKLHIGAPDAESVSATSNGTGPS